MSITIMKIIIVVLVILLAILLFSCAQKAPSNPNRGPASPDTTETPKNWSKDEPKDLNLRPGHGTKPKKDEFDF